MNTFYRGLLIGLSIAAPIGPIGLLCLRRSIAEGPMAGFCAGLGAATADAVYGGLAAFGLAAITAKLLHAQPFIQTAGSCFLIFLGVKIFSAEPGLELAPPVPAGEAGRFPGRSTLLSSYATTVLLTLSNPATIVSFLGIFAGATVTTSGRTSAFLVGGVFWGSALWWLCLSLISSWLTARFKPIELRWLHRIAGSLLIAWGAWPLAQRLFHRSLMP